MVATARRTRNSIRSTNIVQTPIIIICTGSVIPNLQHRNAFSLTKLL
uniref:Golgi SNARE 12 protein n=1 Tax=Arundo donax TaxID=35708 RepID=A0A0A9F0K3_ARUDO